jgi:hypothetical protein
MIAERLSRTVVERIVAAEQDIIVWDDPLPGFGVPVKPSAVRSYIVEYRNGSTGVSKRLTIGRHGPLLAFEEPAGSVKPVRSLRGAVGELLNWGGTHFGIVAGARRLGSHFPHAHPGGAELAERDANR